MATVPREQVTQKAKTNDVSITDGTNTGTAGQRFWLATRDGWDAVTNTKTVASDQDTLDERLALDATVDAPLYVAKVVGNGENVSDKNLVKIGDTTLSAANSTNTTKDIKPFVAGGFGSLNYSIDATSVIDLAGCSAKMAGSTLVFTSGATDGTDVVQVRVTDDSGVYVLVKVDVTVA